LRDLEFNFIELKKFNKQEEELESIIEKWVYFIKNAENLTMIPKSAAEIPELNEAYTLAAMNAWTEEELEIYEYWQIRAAADMYGMEEQFGKGNLEGKLEGKVEIAIEMIKDGESNDKIRKYTGLTDEEIDQLRVEK
jgi:predicted transposase/invertase (TIGR01784 family)